MRVRDRARRGARCSAASLLSVANRPSRRRRSPGPLPALLAAVSVIAIGTAGARAEEDRAATPRLSNAALLEKLDAMERRIKMLEAQLKHKPRSPSPATDKPADRPAPTGPYAQADASKASAAAPAPAEPPSKPILGLADSPIA